MLYEEKDKIMKMKKEWRLPYTKDMKEEKEEEENERYWRRRYSNGNNANDAMRECSTWCLLNTFDNEKIM